jgi:hypothetical protein
MKWVPLAEVLLVNAFLIPLFALISINYGLRDAYWGSPGDGFTYHMVRYPFFFITTARKGSVYIPGLLSVDWQQIVLVIIIVVDAFYIWTALKTGNRA